MATAEHQRTRAVEGIEERDCLVAGRTGKEWRDEEEGSKEGERDRAAPARDGKAEMAGNNRRFGTAEEQAGGRSERDRADLAEGSACEDRNGDCRKGNAGALPIRREALRHAPDRLRDDGDGNEFQAVEQTFRNGAGEGGGAERENKEDECRRQREGAPGGKPARKAVAPEDAEREADLAGSRARQELAERDEIGIIGLVDPFAPHHQFVPEIAEMGDRPAEGGEAELQENTENFERRALGRAGNGQGVVTGVHRHLRYRSPRAAGRPYLVVIPAHIFKGRY